jgi:hypothetical protein
MISGCLAVASASAIAWASWEISGLTLNNEPHQQGQVDPMVSTCEAESFQDQDVADRFPSPPEHPSSIQVLPGLIWRFATTVKPIEEH